MKSDYEVQSPSGYDNKLAPGIATKLATLFKAVRAEGATLPSDGKFYKAEHRQVAGALAKAARKAAALSTGTDAKEYRAIARHMSRESEGCRMGRK